ncbi:uncharacterized protein B0T15DRAFT_143641 [Chaetomium strumarium]|jgi:hypothetical protein|uniref:Uncharacterized protein n=1 Tax=Chaetomium strumarium TaxID=1170767 RepID=A0AAJ0M2H6_9PEZI|nr:hypothetical protein B0T15DRAFT_143641 [Chaetomium strumarium]
MARITDLFLLLVTISEQYRIDESARARPRLKILVGIFTRELRCAYLSLGQSRPCPDLTVSRRAKCEVALPLIVPIYALLSNQFWSSAVEGRDNPSSLELKIRGAESACYFWIDMVFACVSHAMVDQTSLGPDPWTKSEKQSQYCDGGLEPMQSGPMFGSLMPGGILVTSDVSNMAALMMARPESLMRTCRSEHTR